ncbi:MAG TPA: TadE/TadG family type IV pilus assembly protein [Terracidiphilus sp.]|nr:TadE/TadG family type IV pilus assembly protein [Terracidiphilus sp.]
MKYQPQFEGIARVLWRRVVRAAAAPQAHGEPGSPPRRLRALLLAGEEGQSLVEFALVLPMLLVVVTGIMVFGIYETQIMSLTEGVDSAGRVVSVSAGQTLDPCALAATTVASGAPILNAAGISYSITLNPIPGNLTANNHNYTGTGASTSCSGSSTTTGAPGNLVSGGTVTIQATYTACSLKFYGNNLMPGGCSISQQITEVVQ